MNKAKITSLIASAIQKADSSYFNEDYTKQAQAVLAVLDKEGLVMMPKTYPDETWLKAAEIMKTGRVRPEEHVKNVYEVVLKVAAMK